MGVASLPRRSTSCAVAFANAAGLVASAVATARVRVVLFIMEVLLVSGRLERGAHAGRVVVAVAQRIPLRVVPIGHVADVERVRLLVFEAEVEAQSAAPLVELAVGRDAAHVVAPEDAG